MSNDRYANIRRVLAECRDIAMEWTMRGRIPECGKFGEIAQDLAAVCSELEITDSERDQLATALEAAREDVDRLAFLAIKLVVEGFVGGEKHIYDYACDAAEESGRDEPSEADMLAGLRRMIDTARKEARNG